MRDLQPGWTEKLLEVMSAFSRARTPRDAGDVAVRAAVEALGARSAAVALTSPDGALLELVAASGLTPAERARWSAIEVASRSSLSDAVREGRPVFLDSEGEHTGRAAEVPQGFCPPCGSRLAVPLSNGEQILGVLWVGFQAWLPIPGTARSFAQALAAACAQAVERARLLDAEGEARRRLKILADAGEALAAPEISPDAILELVARNASAATGDACVVRLLDEAGATLVPRAAWTRDGAPPPDAAIAPLLASSGLNACALRSLETIAGRVLDPALAGRAVPEELTALGAPGPVQSVIVAPLHIGSRPLGTITVARTRPHEPHVEDDRLLVETLAGRAASAVHKTRLYDEVLRAQRQLEELLARERHAREAAETASHAKDEFLAMLGHELRNPLSPMITALELMRLRGGDPVHDRERTIIERQVQHLLRLVDDLLDVSRITRGKVELKKRAIELGEVIATAIEMASPLLEARRHRLETTVPRAGLLVEGDAARLAQVVSNLLTNAAKYTEPGGLVQVRAAREGSRVVVRVRDSGIGISPELLPRVFDIFVQGKRALDRSQGGLGIGLTIVRTLTELHGGEVAVTSDGPGKGSEFSVALPAADAAALTPLPLPVPPELLRRRRVPGRRVLVVDDNEDAADALADALAATGHQVTVAYDGPGALASIAAARPEVAFLDIGLPVMDGYELARRLRDALGERVKLVALTGYGQEHDRAASRQAGFDEHLVKPVDLARIEALLGEAPLAAGAAAVR